MLKIEKKRMTKSLYNLKIDLIAVKILNEKK